MRATSATKTKTTKTQSNLSRLPRIQHRFTQVSTLLNEQRPGQDLGACTSGLMADWFPRLIGLGDTPLVEALSDFGVDVETVLPGGGGGGPGGRSYCTLPSDYAEGTASQRCGVKGVAADLEKGETPCCGPCTWWAGLTTISPGSPVHTDQLYRFESGELVRTDAVGFLLRGTKAMWIGPGLDGPGAPSRSDDDDEGADKVDSGSGGGSRLSFQSWLRGEMKGDAYAEKLAKGEVPPVFAGNLANATRWPTVGEWRSLEDGFGVANHFHTLEAGYCYVIRRGTAHLVRNNYDSTACSVAGDALYRFWRPSEE
jgi:hypothetical protein